jgi:hypothetical protein
MGPARAGASLGSPPNVADHGNVKTIRIVITLALTPNSSHQVGATAVAAS